MSRWKRVRKGSRAKCEELIVRRDRRGKAVIVSCNEKAGWSFKIAGIRRLFHRCDPHKDWIDAVVEAASKTVSRVVQGAAR